MRIFKVLVLTALTTFSVFAASTAKAGLLIEPYLGYELGTLEQQIPILGTFKGDMSTAQLGAKVAFTFPILFIGADYSLPVGGTIKDQSSSTKYDVTGSQLFVLVGASLPMIRAYAGYGLINVLELKNQVGGGTTRYEGGTAIKLGVGTTMLPFVAINLEYILSNYDKINGTSNSNGKSNFFMLNVSLPFNVM